MKNLILLAFMIILVFAMIPDGEKKVNSRNPAIVGTIEYAGGNK